MLLKQMNNILNRYNKMNIFCYELYTLMGSYANTNKLEYDLELDSELLDLSDKYIK